MYLEIIYYIILLFLISTCFPKGFFKKVRYLSIWLMIFLVMFIAISYKDKLYNNNIVANLIPGQGVFKKKSASFFIADNGHFYIKLDVSGKKIKFLVDTGASDIVLNKKTAKKIGIDIKSLKYNKRYNTANGIVKGASVKISYIALKDVVFNDIFISVNQGKLNEPLLGMKFLKMFKKYEFQGNKLTVYW